ncbi:DegV family protein [Erysipelothrix urinaevulpis]|uniref:DegV family protein n=1 Tax=Erysipelothrix urinaevulpis TaxID=2683717 RepID=UPI00135ABF51|nr:DegV family protein [Erysipelothrix urinaevulpis]
MAIKIITDSTCYLDEALVKQYEIIVLPLYVTFGQESFKETDLDNTVFYPKMEKEGIPISSQPAVGEIFLAMEEILKEGHDVLGIFLSSSMSGTFNSATLISQELSEKYKDAKITILDSKTNSMQLGFTVLEAAKKAQETQNYDEVVDEARRVIDSSRFIFIPENLDYLHKGGRIGGAGTLFGNMLKLTPILTVHNAETSVLKTVRTKKRAKQALIDKMLDDHEKYEIQALAIHHINCYDEAVALQEAIEGKVSAPIHISNIGPVIGLHVGPGAIGFAYHTKNKITD